MTRPFSLRPILTRGRVAASLVSLVPFVYFFAAVRGSLVLAPDDGVIFNVPLRTATANLIQHGFLPLWNPYIFSGMPLFASAQGGVLFPLNWWYVIFSPPVATNVMVLMSYSLAALGAYLYARKAGASIAGGITTSLVWQLSGVLVGQISHINIVQTAALLPWLLWAVDGFGSSGERKWGVLLAILVALQVFVGHPQTFVYSLILVSAYAVVMALWTPRFRFRYLASLILLLTGVFLAAVQILPTFELLRNSVRSDASYDFFASFSLPPRFVQTLLAPYILGGGDNRLFRAPYIGAPYYGEFIGYVGLLTIMLALVAVLLKRDTRTNFWAIVATICFVLALGSNAPFHLYWLIYHVPVLNLFRVPARHLMEVDFALAVLAGRGLTVLGVAAIGKRERHLIAVVCVIILLATCLAVTIWRPYDFRLGREAPVTILRAPELFLPIFLAALSVGALLYLVHNRRSASTLLVVMVLALDLFLWGQFSGWSLSPARTAPEWKLPEVVSELHKLAPLNEGSYRILTAPHTFDPNLVPVPPSVSHSPEWNLWTQPDLYMMHGIQNAAGYDGFGLERYSKLAGEMKVWGELTDPNRTLRDGGREMDILNVRYLISMRKQTGVSPRSETASPSFPTATEKFGELMFAPVDLGLPNVSTGDRLQFTVTPVEVDRIALVTNLSWSEKLVDGTTVGRIRLTGTDGHVVEFALRAGVDTAEWAHDRADIHARIRHKRATVAGSYPVEDSKGRYEGHTYVTSFTLPERLEVRSGEIVVEPSPGAPDLMLSVFRVSFEDSNTAKFYALGRDSINVESRHGPSADKSKSVLGPNRWRRVTQTSDVQIYENRQVLPRAWLVSEARVLDKQVMLGTIRSGKFPDGSNWEPQRSALVESETGFVASAATGGRADVTRYEPNRIEIRTQADAPTILVLSENHYPGWRAYIDGRNVEVLRVDYELRGVVLPAGAHEISFVYRPKSVMIGLLISAITITVLGLWWWMLLPEKRLLALIASLGVRSDGKLATATHPET
jgi:hypothetical protein